MVGREGPRVREHNTRQLIAAVIFFVSTLKGGLALDLFKKGFGLGNAHPLSTKACVSVLATSLFRQIVFTYCALFATQFLTQSSSNNNNNCIQISP